MWLLFVLRLILIKSVLIDDLRISQEFSNYVNPVVGWWLHAEMDCIVNIWDP
jgi:hypothetical protein